jgi:NTP pyrophosphatase (non-canonical NTP hydrolase)
MLMSIGCNLRELGQQSADVIDNFQRIEPRPWTEHVLALELCGEVGSLTHAILAMERYKRRRPSLAAVKNECADVLFIVLRLAGYCELLLPEAVQTSPSWEVESSLTVEGAGLELSQLAGEVAAHVAGQRSILLLETLLRMVALLESVAKHYRFSLRDAYFSELGVCRLWQAKSLATSRWQQRFRRWLGKAE